MDIYSKWTVTVTEGKQIKSELEVFIQQRSCLLPDYGSKCDNVVMESHAVTRQCCSGIDMQSAYGDFVFHWKSLILKLVIHIVIQISLFWPTLESIYSSFSLQEAAIIAFI